MSADQTPTADPTPGSSRVDVAGLRAAAEAATPAPWHAWDRSIGYEVHVGAEHVEPDYKAKRFCQDLNDEFRETFRKADAELIAAARNALPALLDERDDLATRLATAEAEKAAILGQVDHAARILAIGGQVIASATLRAQVDRWPAFVAAAAFAPLDPDAPTGRDAEARCACWPPGDIDSKDGHDGDCPLWMAHHPDAPTGHDGHGEPDTHQGDTEAGA